MVDPTSGRLDELQRFLGVEPAPLRADTLKLNSNDVRDLLENYDELCAAFRETPYADYLAAVEPTSVNRAD